MEFGKAEHIDSVDFSLPPAHTDCAQVLPGFKSKTPEVYVGGTRWGVKEWKGTYYPEKARTENYLGHYSQLFNAIELNATHYNTFSENTLRRWTEQVGTDFRFYPKMHQVVSHRLRLKKALKQTEKFIEQVDNLGQNRGTILLQLPDNYHYENFESFEEYLRQFPRKYALAVELRGENWLNDRLFYLLQELDLSLVITDTAGKRTLLHNRLCNKEVFIRFVGNNLHHSDFERIDAWTNLLLDWVNSGLEKIGFFIHQSNELHTPELAAYVAAKFNEAFGTKLPIPQKNNLFNL
ncbi:DUF72 domain-containing protein [bacterium]|nr:DUF72 domain-containing protein [bacterium]